MKMLLSTRAKPAHAEVGKQSAFILYFFSEVAERFLLKHANINLICLSLTRNMSIEQAIIMCVTKFPIAKNVLQINYYLFAPL